MAIKYIIVLFVETPRKFITATAGSTRVQCNSQYVSPTQALVRHDYQMLRNV
jgi:hypothetical protein